MRLCAEKIGDLERVLKEKRRSLFVILSREKAKLGLFLEGTRKAPQGWHLCLP